MLSKRQNNTLPMKIIKKPLKLLEKDMEKTIEKKSAEMRKCLGDCFKCRHHGTIEKICRITGCLCKYPMKNCENKDYPWG